MPSNLDRYRRIAPIYDLLDLPFEYGRYRRIRPLLFAGLSGRILDAGVGTGRNFEFYPPGVSITGIDFSTAMLAQALRRVGISAATVELREMDVTRLDFSAGSFDGAVATFLFCVLPDDQQVVALRELGRVVKPGGPSGSWSMSDLMGRSVGLWRRFGNRGLVGHMEPASTGEPKNTSRRRIGTCRSTLRGG